jgi:hypothetical protein
MAKANTPLRRIHLRRCSRVWSVRGLVEGAPTEADASSTRNYWEGWGRRRTDRNSRRNVRFRGERPEGASGLNNGSDLLLDLLGDFQEAGFSGMEFVMPLRLR